jgi:Fasciclin domain
MNHVLKLTLNVVVSSTASNGVIHVIDEVLLPSQVTTSILELALATPSLSTLASLLTAAGIANLFGDDAASFTVFAPTNEAFAKLDPSLVASLTNPANVQALLDVLQFHGTWSSGSIEGVLISARVPDAIILIFVFSYQRICGPCIPTLCWSTTKAWSHRHINLSTKGQ